VHYQKVDATQSGAHSMFSSRFSIVHLIKHISVVEKGDSEHELLQLLATMVDTFPGIARSVYLVLQQLEGRFMSFYLFHSLW
jgi:hypothetical protein